MLCDFTKKYFTSPTFRDSIVGHLVQDPGVYSFDKYPHDLMHVVLEKYFEKH